MKDDTCITILFVVFILGTVLGIIAIGTTVEVGGALQQRCNAICSPLVGDDHEKQCWCGTATGWVPVVEVAR